MWWNKLFVNLELASDFAGIPQNRQPDFLE